MTTFSKAAKERLKEAEKRKLKPEGKFEPIDLSTRDHPEWMTRAFSNNRYIVMVMDNAKTDKGEAIRAMVQTVDDRPIHNHWSEMQRIKNELFGKDAIAVEYYPKDSDLIDHFNIYWMWIFPEGVLPIPAVDVKEKYKGIQGESQKQIARTQTKIDSKYLIGTLAFHQTGPLSRKEDLFRAYGETQKYWVGMWVTGYGFFDVLFPKETSRELTQQEVDHYNNIHIQIGSQPAQKLKVD